MSSPSPARRPGPDTSAARRGTTGPAYAPPARGRATATPLPLVFGLTSVVLSLGLAVYVVAAASATVVFLGVPLPLVTADRWWLSFLGYLLTPMVVIGCYGWDSIGQRNSLRRNRNFSPRPASTRTLLWAAGVSVLIGAWHVLNLSVPLSEAWGLS